MNLGQEGSGPLGDPHPNVKVTWCASRDVSCTFLGLTVVALPSWELVGANHRPVDSQLCLHVSCLPAGTPGMCQGHTCGDFPGPSPASVPQPGSRGSH